jgi:hypothetical protein
MIYNGITENSRHFRFVSTTASRRLEAGGKRQQEAGSTRQEAAGSISSSSRFYLWVGFSRVCVFFAVVVYGKLKPLIFNSSKFIILKSFIY